MNQLDHLWICWRNVSPTKWVKAPRSEVKNVSWSLKIKQWQSKHFSKTGQGGHTASLLRLETAPVTMLAMVRKAIFLQQRAPLWIFWANGGLITEGCHPRCLKTPNALARVKRERRGEWGLSVCPLSRGQGLGKEAIESLGFWMSSFFPFLPLSLEF